MAQPIRQCTRYATFQDAQADGWRRVNRKADRDISGGNFVGYAYQSPTGNTASYLFTRVMMDCFTQKADPG